MTADTAAGAPTDQGGGGSETAERPDVEPSADRPGEGLHAGGSDRDPARAARGAAGEAGDRRVGDDARAGDDARSAGGVDVTALRRYLDAPRADDRDRVREVLCDPAFAVEPGADIEEHRDRVDRQMRTLVEAGGSRLGFPEAYGGESDIAGSVIAFEMLAMRDLSLLVKAGVQFGLFGGAVLHLGTERHHDRYLADIMNYELPGCFAMTEAGHGSNVQALETVATYDPDTDEFVVHTPTASARKTWIGNAARDGRMAAVFAQLDVGGERHGVHCLLVPIRDEDGHVLDGVTVADNGRKLGLNGVDNGELSFDHVRVPRDNLLDRFADVTADGEYRSPIDNPDKRFFTMLGTLIQGRISVSGAAVTAAKLALTIAVRYGDRRRQFGPPDADHEVVLLDYLAHQRRLLPRLASTYALHFAQKRVVAELDKAFGDHADDYPEEQRRQLETRAAGIKTATTWHATDTVQACREACGGVGYLAANRFADLKADTDVFTTFEGDNTVLLQLVAKSVLTEFRDEFGELDPIGTARFVADQVVEMLVERTSARQIAQRLGALVSRDDHADLRDRDYQRELFAWREEHVIAGVARRLKNGIDDGRAPFEVFNECQDHVLLAAQAHIDRLVMEDFASAVEECDDEATAGILDALCDLHALSTIERERAWFQEHGRLSGDRSKAVITAVNELCAQLRPHAVDLVEAFGIPDEILGAPIAIEEDIPHA